MTRLDLLKLGCSTALLLLGAACGSESSVSADETAEQRREDGGDGGPIDAAHPASDGDCVPFVSPPPEACKPPEDGVLPVDLRCTGLYGDFDARTLACGVHEYKPAYELWSDGAQKRRFVQIPRGQKIDVSNPDEFTYPEGTKFWKEFRVKAASGQLRMGETRLLEKTADGWLYTSYVWSEDEKTASQMNNTDGVANLYGTGHTVPTRDHCADCHKGRLDYVLGWDALMLGPGAQGVTRDDLQELGFVDDASTLALAIPGNEVEQKALGYMHANCGVSCHNDNFDAPARDTALHLRLEAPDLASVQTTDAFKAINKRPADNAKYEGLTNVSPDNWYDVRPGDPERSLIIGRQLLRGFEGQMPRIGTNKVDETGVKLVSDWIDSMNDNDAYPRPEP